jgi:SAM-dependent methyltransferase
MAPERSFPRTEAVENCPVCGYSETFEMFSSPDLLHGVPGNFSYHRCKGCDSVFQNPMVVKEDLHLCYPNNYTPYSYDPETPNFDFDALAKGSRTALRNAVAKSVWGEPVSGFIGLAGRILAKSRTLRERAFYGAVMDACIPRSRGKENALEIGCGAGWMLKRLTAVGWLADGVEWDHEAAKLAADRTRCKIWSGDFMEADLPTANYQLIFLSHVFEHLYSPAASLERFSQLLAPGGKVILLFPNSGSSDAGWFQKYWFPWDPPRHLILPSVRAVFDLAKNAGFEVDNCYTNVGKWVWQNSKAYKLNKHPDTFRANLSMLETLAFNFQRLKNAVGFRVGSEVVVVLKKS